MLGENEKIIPVLLIMLLKLSYSYRNGFISSNSLEAVGFLTNAVLCWVLITNGYNCLQRSAHHVVRDKREIWHEGKKQGLGTLFPLKAKLVLGTANYKIVTTQPQLLGWQRYTEQSQEK